MKHYFHFLFSAALLLGSFILFNNQESERPGTLKEHPQIEQQALHAEAPSRDASESVFQSNRLSTGIASRFPSDNFRKTEFPNRSDHRVCMKRQALIHLDLKPRIARLSGPCLLHPASYDDPSLS